MRLIRTTSKDPEFVYFADEQEIPGYAILSHVWAEEEVTFQHIQDPSNIQDMKGWSKLVRACEVARSEDYEYIWIDTCCIDKSSSSELSEAINSMYRYYSNAMVCYVYLADMWSDLPRSFSVAFRKCKWFTRGWTLQELIAPETVVFFTKDWKEIGTKASLQEILTDITGIPSKVLLSWDDPSMMSIAARMSWAAGRKTTRIEDRAYSLMGIFGVFMPTIYGEGEHAFIRLQQEILKVSDDHTIFAWKSEKLSRSPCGILATSPDLFKGSGKYERRDPANRRPFSMTNIGLLVHLSLLPAPVRHTRRIDHDQRPEFLALLNCRAGTSDRLAIRVKRSNGHQYERVRSHILEEDPRNGKITELLFKAWDLPVKRMRSHLQRHQISVFFVSGQGIRPVRALIEDQPFAAKTTDTTTNSMGVFTPDGSHPSAFFFIHEPSHRPFVVVAGLKSGNFWLDLVLDLEADNPNVLTDIQQSYKDVQERQNVPEKCFDRISKFLTDNVTILIEARRQNRQSKFDNLPRYILNICCLPKADSETS